MCLGLSQKFRNDSKAWYVYRRTHWRTSASEASWHGAGVSRSLGSTLFACLSKEAKSHSAHIRPKSRVSTIHLPGSFGSGVVRLPPRNTHTQHDVSSCCSHEHRWHRCVLLLAYIRVWLGLRDVVLAINMSLFITGPPRWGAPGESPDFNPAPAPAAS